MELFCRSLLDNKYFSMGRLMPKFEFVIGPSFIASTISCAMTVFLGGMIWAQLTGEQAQLRRDVDQTRSEIQLMRAYDTSIQLLRNDMGHIKTSVDRIERMMKLGN